MARRQDVSQALRSNRQLRQFVLADVTPTGSILGCGSYGSVEEVMYKRLVCAGKRLHEVLVDAKNDGVTQMIDRYLQECQLMSSLRHPNITQFLGLCFLPDTTLPLLVMERLETSLDSILEHMPNLPLSLKRSVLEDVASGLLYLHERSPPVIHRDLTANNVLLTSALTAKITDMGNSRIIDMRPGQMTRRLTKVPGTLAYMPPEALSENSCYGTSLDIFSFGHLALFTLTQIFPADLLPSTFCHPDNPKITQGRSEVERREKYVSRLESLIEPLYPALVELVKQCLHNLPNHRPSTNQLLARLQKMREEVEGEYGCSLVKVDMTKLRLVKELKVKEKELKMKDKEMAQEKERYETQLWEMAKKLEENSKQLRETTRLLAQLALANKRKPDGGPGKADGGPGKPGGGPVKPDEVPVAGNFHRQASVEQPGEHENPYRNIPHVVQVSDDKEQPEEQGVILDRLKLDESCIHDLTQFISGSFSSIYKATYRASNGKSIPVAVKTSKYEKNAKAFWEQMRIMSHMLHPNVVRLFGMVLEKNWIVLEYLSNKDLGRFLKQNHRDVSCLIKYMMDVANGMKHISSLGLIHRDLAIRNVLVSKDEVCKVADFRLARSVGKDPYHFTGTTQIPLRWCAPEVFIQRMYYLESDVWSYGIVMWEMANPTKIPYQEYEDYEVGVKIRDGWTPGVPSEYPKAVKDIMRECWMVEPGQRPTFHQISTQLSKAK